LQGERAGATEAEGHAGVHSGIQGGERAVEDHRTTEDGGGKQVRWFGLGKLTEDGGGKQVCWFWLKKITTQDSITIFVG